MRQVRCHRPLSRRVLLPSLLGDQVVVLILFFLLLLLLIIIFNLREKVKSGATLIVSPSSISFQWIEEIQKHVKHKDIKMLFYKGSKEMGYMQPRTLAGYDIVVTTYETLAAETSYVDLPHSNSSEGRRFRNPKRYMAMPSPIVCIEWWRICLDEAQMIESTTTKTAEMAMKLSAVNRYFQDSTKILK